MGYFDTVNYILHVHHKKIPNVIRRIYGFSSIKDMNRMKNIASEFGYSTSDFILSSRWTYVASQKTHILCNRYNSWRNQRSSK